MAETRGNALFFHPSPEDRTRLGEALTRLGFEAIPLGKLEELSRYAQALTPRLVLLPPEAFENQAVPELARRRDLLVVALGEPAEEDEENEASRARARALYLPLQGNDAGELARRLDLVLLASRSGLEVGESGENLVGSIAQVPFLEVAQRLAAARFGGRLELGAEEWLAFEQGRPLAARAGKAKGAKAFCRLSQHLEGSFAVRPGAVDAPREIEESLDALVQRAFNDNLAAPLDAALRLRLELGPSFFEQEFKPLEKQLLTLAQKPCTVGAVFDALESATDGEISHQISGLLQRGFLVLEKPAARVRIVTDSTADLPADIARAAGIGLVPLRVHFGAKVYRDRIDLQPRLFYDLLQQSKDHPQSSPPSAEEFAAFYQKLLAQSDVVSLHISNQLSLTGAHAASAADAARIGAAHQIEIVDSRQAGLGLGLLALIASRLAARGQNAAEIAAKLRQLTPRTYTFFGVDTLEFLVKGGRLSRTRGFVGSMLGIKPILGLEEGAIVPVDRVRGGRAIQPKLLELLAAKVDAQKPIHAAILHAAAPVWADRLRRLLLERFRCAEVLIGEIGPVVGTHVGPGAVGLAALQPSAEELPLFAPLA